MPILGSGSFAIPSVKEDKWSGGQSTVDLPEAAEFLAFWSGGAEMSRASSLPPNPIKLVRLEEATSVLFT